MNKIILRRPDDMHFHPRTGAMLQQVLPYTSKVFSRGVVMGNLPKPVVTVDDAVAYWKEIMSVDSTFHPIMTIMLTKQTTPEIISDAFRQGIKVLKYIPNNVSTNSEEGVAFSDLLKYYFVLETAQKLGMIFAGHWESPFDANGIMVSEMEMEKHAIRFLNEIVKLFPSLKITVEHASTEEMIEYVKETPINVGATLTIHHALLTYDDVCYNNGEIYNPYHYCKPIVKNSSDKNAIMKTMMSGNPKFFFGSDSAPHPKDAKEKKPPSAGIFTAPVILPLLCDLFKRNHALSKLEDFVSKFGAEFYGLPLNKETVTLVKEDWTVPMQIGGVVPFKAGAKLQWKLT